VWDFVQEDGQGGDLSDALSGDEGSPDGQTVGEVVERVGEQVQVAGNFHLANFAVGTLLDNLRGFLERRILNLFCYHRRKLGSTWIRQ